MGWKTIKGRQYYYRSQRQGGRVVSQYLGRGESAAFFAELDAGDCRERVKDRLRARLDREEERELEDALDRLVTEVLADATACLQARGYHRHNRGAWRRRRRRNAMDQPNAGSPATPGTATAPAPGGPRPLARFQSIVDDWAASTLAKDVASEGSQPKSLQRLYRDVESHAEELAGPNPSPIECDLARTAALAWLALRYLEVAALGRTGRTIPQANYDIHRLDRAHARYVGTLKTLAQIRRLNGPTVQVINMGGQNQTNVLGSPSKEG